MTYRFDMFEFFAIIAYDISFPFNFQMLLNKLDSRKRDYEDLSATMNNISSMKHQSFDELSQEYMQLKSKWDEIMSQIKESASSYKEMSSKYSEFRSKFAAKFI